MRVSTWMDLLAHIGKRIDVHSARAEQLAESIKNEMTKPMHVRDYRAALILTQEHGKVQFAISELRELLDWNK
jgi:hypothetical protein